jgi:hypothetical protein
MKFQTGNERQGRHFRLEPHHDEALARLGARPPLPIGVALARGIRPQGDVRQRRRSNCRCSRRSNPGEATRHDRCSSAPRRLRRALIGRRWSLRRFRRIAVRRTIPRIKVRRVPRQVVSARKGTSVRDDGRIVGAREDRTPVRQGRHFRLEPHHDEALARLGARPPLPIGVALARVFFAFYLSRLAPRKVVHVQVCVERKDEVPDRQRELSPLFLLPGRRTSAGC